MLDRNAPIKIIVALGNPGSRHEGTPHNAGYLWLERYILRLGGGYHLKSWRNEAECGTDGRGVLLVKPLTFMNLSGQPVAEVLRRTNHQPNQILVVHDEIDLPLGSARFKFGGGMAGHKGVASVAEGIGTRDFWRLRLGIGAGGAKEDMAAYVLRKMALPSFQLLEESVERTLNVFMAVLEGDMENAMKSLHTEEAGSEAKTW